MQPPHSRRKLCQLHEQHSKFPHSRDRVNSSIFSSARYCCWCSFPFWRSRVCGLPLFLFRFLGAAAFISGVYAVSERRAQWIVALVLAISAGVLNAVFAFRPDPRLAVPTLILTILFLAFTLVSLLRAVVRAQRVTRDTIYGALSVYLLMATTWAAAYLLLVTVQPDAIVMDAARHPHHTMDWFDCVFYSYVTLTSLGYGDIVPMTAQARSLSILEAVSGIMYVAVLIARLVGSFHAAAKSQVNPEAGGFNG